MKTSRTLYRSAVRVALGVALILSLPLVAMLITDDVVWSCLVRVWAWERLRQAQGQVRVAALNQELGWSRKRLVARVREQLGLPPKAVGRLLRFEHARRLAGTMSWGELAFTCGFADQPHLISEFRAFTGQTPETFLRDSAAAAA